MKKKFALALAVVMMMTMVLSSCGSKGGNLTFTTGGETGTYYGFGTVLAGQISDKTDTTVTAIVGAGSKGNIEAMDLGDAQMGLVQSDVMAYAYEGTSLFDKKIESFSTVAALYMEQVQIVTLNPDIKTVADLKGKNVSIGSSGSGVYFNALDFLAGYGMTEADIVPQYLSFGDSAEALKDGKIDAAFVVAGAPTPAVTDLCTTKGAYLINLDDAAIAKMQEINPSYAKAVIPAGTYEGIDEDVTTVAIKATIIANSEVSEDDAYTIVSAIFENAAAITEAHAKGAELDLAYASECGLPYHAGAAKYFAEKGITVQTAE